MMLTHEQVERFVLESNRIEGIGSTCSAELAEFRRFMHLDVVKIDDLVAFVSVYQPNAKLRTSKGMDVKVGNHLPPPGGMAIIYQLSSVISNAHHSRPDPWMVHIQYETLHPFTDGNGRSGRMLWYWMMRDHPKVKLGFLHAFYYQTLDKVGR